MKQTLFLLLQLVLAGSLVAQEIEVEELYRIQNGLPLLSHSNDAVYKLTDKDVMVRDGAIIDCTYAFRCKTLIIPDSLDGQLVTKIGFSTLDEEKGIFSRLHLVNIEFPSSLMEIGDYAFANNDLRRVHLSNLKCLSHIGMGAFQNNKLQSIRLQGCDSLRRIGRCAFLNTRCSYKLPVNRDSAFIGWTGGSPRIIRPGQMLNPTVEELHVVMSPTMEYYTLQSKDVVVEEGVLISCSYDFTIRNIQIPECLDGQIIHSIGVKEELLNLSKPGIFEEARLTSVSFASSIRNIGTRAFRNNYLRSLDLKHVEHISDFAFSKNNLENVVFGPNQLKYIGAFAFENNLLTTLDFRKNEKLELIETGAFRENELTVLQLPEPKVPARFVVANMDAFSKNPGLK